ncbi:hypothetical protein L2X99_04095 [Microbacterium sp. KUDC0406]|uniref:hypothetical protein n=1 Tax=Microbacterium sp. KUDC0406 TaxID=2909588 RepID=UPI001F1EE7C9|nr:hypothetical protein [Microbacterium sp. KUDC0406]UJP10824.1 hypothetical protein L2X99_04095 [Microbacterium sp. KUDC0406]
MRVRTVLLRRDSVIVVIVHVIVRVVGIVVPGIRRGAGATVCAGPGVAGGGVVAGMG